MDELTSRRIYGSSCRLLAIRGRYPLAHQGTGDGRYLSGAQESCTLTRVGGDRDSQTGRNLCDDPVSIWFTKKEKGDGKELTPLRTVLPRPANHRRIRKLPVQIAIALHIRLARTIRLQVLIDVLGKVWISRPTLHFLGNFLLLHAHCGIGSRTIQRPRLDPIAQLPEACVSALDTV
jgi:hypothetical protein